MTNNPHLPIFCELYGHRRAILLLLLIYAYRAINYKISRRLKGPSLESASPIKIRRFVLRNAALRSASGSSLIFAVELSLISDYLKYLTSIREKKMLREKNARRIPCIFFFLIKLVGSEIFEII